jgi:hypothetical protein
MDTLAPQKRIIAIDPGGSGGIAWQEEDYVISAKMPETEGDILFFFQRFKPTAYTVFMEEVSGYIGRPQPGSAMFKFGRHTGFVIGVLMALGFRLEMVRPQKWQKNLGLGTSATCASKADWKRKLKAEAQRKFPGVGVTLYNADALLILDYAANSNL